MLRNLKAEMVRQNVTIGTLANLMGLSRNGLSMKINERGSFTVAEKFYIATLLGVDENATAELFASDRGAL